MPVETKVKASTAAAAVSGIVLWIIGRYAFKGGAVPDVVASWVYVAVPAVVTFGAGYLAKHTPRPVAAAAGPIISVQGTLTEAQVAEIKRQLAAVTNTPAEKTLMRPDGPEPPAAPGQEA
jgi:hypothetical protein